MAILKDEQAELEALRAQNAKLKAALESRNNRALSWKVSEKGAVSIYGMGRFPVTLYPTQIRKLDGVWNDLTAWVEVEIEAGRLKASKFD